MRRLSLILSFVVLAAGLGGCTLGPLESARTLPPRTTSVQIVPSFVINENSGDRPFIYSMYIDVGVRVGATDHLDVGARLFNGLGLLGDVKYNFMSPESNLAVALQGGFGFGFDLDGASTLHLPIRALISYMVRDRFEPYASIGYGFFWFFGRDIYEEPGVDYADRGGYGDGMLQITAGARLILFSGRRTTGHLALGYSYWHQVVDDPGDNYSMIDNHFVGLGFGMEILPRDQVPPLEDEMMEPPEDEPYDPDAGDPYDYEPPPPPDGVDSPWDVTEVEPELAPEEPEAAPDEPEAAPEEPEAAPEEPEAAPEEPEAAPAEPEAAPAEPEAAP